VWMSGHDGVHPSGSGQWMLALENASYYYDL